MISQGAFAKHIGVAKSSVIKAIRVGRIPVYDEHGNPISPATPGRKWIDPEEGASAFRTVRARIDDHVVDGMTGEDSGGSRGGSLKGAPAPSAGKTLVDAKADKERLQAELLRLKLGRERGELVSRQSQLDAFETAGRNVARQFQTMTTWAEELNGVARGGVPALTAWLRAKAIECCTNLADALTDEDAGEVGDDADNADATE